METRLEAVRPVDDMESPLIVVRTRQVPPRGFQIRRGLGRQRMSCEVRGCHEGGCTTPEC